MELDGEVKNQVGIAKGKNAGDIPMYFMTFIYQMIAIYLEVIFI